MEILSLKWYHRDVNAKPIVWVQHPGTGVRYCYGVSASEKEDEKEVCYLSIYSPFDFDKFQKEHSQVVMSLNEVLAQLRPGQPVPEHLRRLIPTKMWSKLFQVFFYRFFMIIWKNIIEFLWYFLLLLPAIHPGESRLQFGRAAEMGQSRTGHLTSNPNGRSCESSRRPHFASLCLRIERGICEDFRGLRRYDGGIFASKNTEIFLRVSGTREKQNDFCNLEWRTHRPIPQPSIDLLR